VDHPQHSLAVVLSLANANIDAELVKVKTTRKSESSARLSRNAHDDANAEQVHLATTALTCSILFCAFSLVKTQEC